MRCLIDVSGLLWRSAYSKDSLTDHRGDKTNIIFGVLSSLWSLLPQLQATEIVLCYDAEDGSERRRALYPEYKANRKKDPEMVDEMRRQAAILSGFFAVLPVIEIKQAGVEADDIIGELIKFLKHEDVAIISSDQDLQQLTSRDNHLMLAFDGLPENPDLTPAQVVAYKCIVGDSSDNIKGIAGLGDKKTRALLKKHGSLKKIVSHARKAGKLGRNTFEEALAILQRNLDLIRLDGRLLKEEERKSILDSYRRQRELRPFNNPHRGALKKLLQEYSFNSFLRKWDKFCEDWSQLSYVADKYKDNTEQLSLDCPPTLIPLQTPRERLKTVLDAFLLLPLRKILSLQIDEVELLQMLHEDLTADVEQEVDLDDLTWLEQLARDDGIELDDWKPPEDTE